jgi:hypothetical protein
MPDWFAPVISVIALFGVIAGPVIAGIAQSLTSRADRRLAWRRQRVEYLVEVKAKLIELKVEMDIAYSAKDRQRYLAACSAFFAQANSLDDKRVREKLLNVPQNIVIDTMGTYENVALTATAAFVAIGGTIREEMTKL